MQGVDVPTAELDAIAANLQPRLRTFGPQARMPVHECRRRQGSIWHSRLCLTCTCAHVCRALQPGCCFQFLPPSPGPNLSQSLANIAWAYATLGHCPPPPFVQTLGSAALPQLPAFEPQGLSLLVWSLASLGCRHIKLFHE